MQDTAEVVDNFLALDRALAASFGDDPLEWANASSVRSVAMAAVDKLLENDDPWRRSHFSGALACEISGGGSAEADRRTVAILRATPAQIVRSVIAVLDWEAPPLPQSAQHAFTNLQTVADNLRLFVLRLDATAQSVNYKVNNRTERST